MKDNGLEWALRNASGSVGNAIADAAEELRAARDAYPPFHTAHEGFAVLLEEVDELKAHVWTRQGTRNVARMRHEAIQVAAMALRFALDVCDELGGQR